MKVHSIGCICLLHSLKASFILAQLGRLTTLPLLSIVSFNSSHFNINFSILVIMMCLFFLSWQARSLNPQLKYKFSLNQKLGEPLKKRQQDYDALRTSLKSLVRSLYVCVYIICK